MRLGKLRAIIYRHGTVDVYLLSNGATPQFVALLQDLSRIDTWERRFHLITKSGTCLWVDEIQNGETEHQEALAEAKSERDRSEL